MYDEQQELEEKMAKIVDQIGCLMMDFILIGIKKIQAENQFLKELLEIKMQEQRENDF